MKKKFLFLSSSRADFGLIYNLYKTFKSHKDFSCYFACSGSVVSSSYGYNEKQIIQIDKEIIFLNKGSNKFVSTPDKITKYLGNINSELIRYCLKLKPNAAFILGDRIETIYQAISLKVLNIPIVHLHGGELTEGIYDDYWRHATSKMSNIHFVSHKKYKSNLIKMGEDKKKIYVVGAYGIDNIIDNKKNFMQKSFFEKEYNFRFNDINFILTFHSVTLKPENNIEHFKIILKCLLKIKNANIFISHPGYDLYSELLIKEIRKKRDLYRERIFTFSNLGNLKYLSLVNLCDIVLGNSSSGIIEVPYLNKPVIDIGERQKGRIKSNLVFNCSNNSREIEKTLLKVIKKIKDKSLPKNNKIYGNGKTAKKTLKIIKNIDFTLLINKKFF